MFITSFYQGVVIKSEEDKSLGAPLSTSAV